MSEDQVGVVNEELIELVCELRRLDTKGMLEVWHAQWLCKELAPLYDLGELTFFTTTHDPQLCRKAAYDRANAKAPHDGVIATLVKSGHGGSLFMQKEEVRISVLLRELAVLQLMQAQCPINYEDCAEFGNAYWKRLQKAARSRQSRYNKEFEELVQLAQNAGGEVSANVRPLLAWGPLSALRERVKQAGLLNK
jgi:hypothetical protein